LGAVSLIDPQTGHYAAEIPVAPAMLGSPEVVTGADLARFSTNATAGSVAYQWRAIETAGFSALGGGEFGLVQGEFYQGYTQPINKAGTRLGMDLAYAHSDANGSIRFGDHVVDRMNARIQLSTPTSQTDLFAGYQDKFFGWPNLYTPFNSNESEDIQTLLLLFNHRVDLAAEDFIEFGAYYRRNEDDYAFNRFAPVGPVHPFQHTTWVRGAAASGRITVREMTFNLRAEIISDELESTSLTFGPYRDRTLTKLALVPERTFELPTGARLRIKAGVTHDDTNRGEEALSPIVEVTHDVPGTAAHRAYVSYSESSQVPTYTALKSNPAAGLFRGNQNLGRQTSQNAEVGVSGRWAGWTAQSAFFYRRDHDLVDWTFQRGVTARSANEVDVDTSGWEFVGQRSWDAVDLVLGYTWLAKDADYKTASVDASFYALNYARHRLTAAIVARVSPRLELRMDNELRFQTANFLRTTGGDEALFSSLGVTFRPAGRRLSITVQTDNLWDADYQSVPAVPAARRQTSAWVRYAW
jgi:hypothetical protein